ncbi:MAG: PIN domain-containing protein [Promicromonosporaceae bacterium]|nr:PIN domain-containing protein [Promicromonosporaceae bacterium]
MILLDTNILIDRERFTFDDDELYAASILTRAEFEFGIHAASSPALRAERAARLEALDGEFDWLPFDVACTRSYGEIAAGATVTGAKVRGKDAMLAAQAHRHGASVMTANIADFKPFEPFIVVLSPALCGVSPAHPYTS